jgi:diguanylate cyclase (GGDEF)-like protein
MRLTVRRLGSIRSRILAFALLATLVPSGITMGISYVQSRRAFEAKVSQDLLSASSQTARATGVWLKERQYDLRVFASSDEVANHLDPAGAGKRPTNRGRLNEYLVSLHDRFPDYARLLVLDLQGHVVGTSTRNSATPSLPRGWQRSLRTQNQFVGDPYWDKRSGTAKLIVAVPVSRADTRLVGAFAAEVNIAPMNVLLREFAKDSSSAIHLLTTNGALIASTEGISAKLAKASLASGALTRLSRENAVVSFRSLTGRDVVGALAPVPQVPWLVVAELSSDVAFQQTRRSRDVSLLIFVILLVAVGASGWRFGLLIAQPLDRLTQAAAEVASGDLAVDLPEGGSGEVGSLTTVFNHMVSRLREGRRKLDEINETLRAKNEELERLSTTDGLTGLANHRFLMQRLKEEGVRSNRHNRPFSVLMADVDHFKAYNDAFGHPAGDEVLKKVAAILREATRAMDCAARYGGEEFAVVMSETGITGAVEVAERIRARIAAESFPGRQITLSIGVAEFPRHADVPQGIVAVADRALYQAKREGRDRVVEARRAAKAKV